MGATVQDILRGGLMLCDHMWTEGSGVVQECSEINTALQHNSPPDNQTTSQRDLAVVKPSLCGFCFTRSAYVLELAVV